MMLKCWHEIPTKRPSFTDLREELEELMTANDKYCTLLIDKDSAYYHYPSFKSISDNSENDALIENITETPMFNQPLMSLDT